MRSTNGLGLIAAWFVFGQARIVLTSKLAEHRIDRPGLAKALAFNREAARARRDAANYDPLGRRLLPWYRAVNTTYWVAAAAGCCWAVLRG